MADLIFYDRSRVTLDHKCPRARFWGNEFEGLGVVPANRPIYFSVGDAIHKGIAGLVQGEDPDEVIHDNVKPFELGLLHIGYEPWKAAEQACLVEGILWGFTRHVLPGLLREYRPVGVEEEFTFDHDGCQQGVRPDLLAERISDGTLWYWEWKSTSSVGERWFGQWARAIQLHTTAWTVGQHLKRPVDGIIIQGLYKGYEREGKQLSIFCYGYERPGLVGGPEQLFAWRAGAKRFPVWERTGGVKKWVYEMPTEVLSEQFAQTPPIFLQERLVQRFLAQTAMREKEIAGAIEAFTEKDQEAMLDAYFPQHFGECEPPIGAKCAYCDLCFNVLAAEDPLNHGYTWREPHHTTDRKGLQRLAELREGIVIK